jgi:hypothetical protein
MCLNFFKIFFPPNFSVLFSLKYGNIVIEYSLFNFTCRILVKFCTHKNRGI